MTTRSKILFIDDETEILNTYKSIFKREEASSGLSAFLDEEEVPVKKTIWDDYQFDIEVASQGQEGIEIFKKSLINEDPFNVVFVDMRMPPGINGVETIKKIREIDDRVEFVLITAYSDLNLDEINDALTSPDKLVFFKKPFYNEEIKQLALNLTTKYINNEIKNDFISNVSHELRTPLASIIGFTRLLEDGEGLDEEQKEFVGIVKDNAVLMEQLVSELIMSVQIKKKGFSFSKEPIDYSAICYSVSRSMGPIFEGKSEINFNFEIPDEKLMICADELKIKQVLINLLNNAYKFTESGNVSLILERNGDEVVTKVKDSGVGIPKAQQEAIFNRFTRVEDKHHSIPGLGLGLNLAHEIVKGHEGELFVESEESKGSEFYFALKLVE